MHIILISECCGKGFSFLNKFIDANLNNKENITLERRQIHSRQIDIMTALNLTVEDIKKNPYIIVCDDNKMPIRFFKAQDWENNIIQKG